MHYFYFDPLCLVWQGIVALPPNSSATYPTLAVAVLKVKANLKAADLPQDLFDLLVSADAFERLKPAPDIFLAAADTLGVDPANCIVIEDALAGVQAALAAGWLGAHSIKWIF